MTQDSQSIATPRFYGLSRPGRSAHGAIREAAQYIQDGAKVVVDVDLSLSLSNTASTGCTTPWSRKKHLMGRLAKSIGDRRMLRIIRQFLRAGVMMQGVVMERHMGTPQGGPLSPLLANILLDEVDKDLEKRGHAFVRYADDLRVFVRSHRAGERVMAHLRRQFDRLHLVINEEKSAIASAFKRPFLGFSFWSAKGRVIKMRVAPKALLAMKARVRLLTRRSAGWSMKNIALDLRRFLVGWKGYFRLATSPGAFKTIDIWIRRRLRAVQLKQWCRSKKPYRELRKTGMGHSADYKATSNGGRYWHSSKGAINVVLTLRFFDELGIPSLAS